MIGHAQIKALMPHRSPLLLVDAITSLQEWTSITGVKAVTGTEPCYAALSDRAPPPDYAYPCSLIVESFGQTGGVLINSKRRREGAPGDVVMLFAGLTNFRFLDEVFPGDTMTHRVFLVKDLTDFAILNGEVRVGDRRIAEAESIIVAYRRMDQVPALAGRG